MKPYLPTFLLLTLCIALPPAFLSLSSVGCSAYSRVLPLLLFHFTHANPFHLLANTLALLLIKPRFSTLPLAFLAAALAAALLYIAPALALSACASAPHPHLPTCGLSALICAICARRYASWRKPITPFLLLQLPFALIPNFNFLLHITSFLISYLLWKIAYLLKAGRPTSSSPRTNTAATASYSKA